MLCRYLNHRLAKVPLADNHPQHPPPEQINPARAEPLCVPIMHARLSGAAYLLDQSTRSLVIILIHFKFAFASAATGTQYPLYYEVLRSFQLGEVFDSFFAFFWGDWNTTKPPKKTKGAVLSFMKAGCILDSTKDPTDCEITSIELSKGTSGSVPLKVIRSSLLALAIQHLSISLLYVLRNHPSHVQRLSFETGSGLQAKY